MKTPTGWLFNNFGVYQKKKDKVYVYVTPIIGGYKAQLYLAGRLTFATATCLLEVQTSDTQPETIARIFSISEEWLYKYSDGDINNIHQDKFSIANPNGVWVKDHYKKGWII